jgi:catechol 2,3-dioxygenase-like lactoylglutathione lyase family enzyme
MSDAKEINLSQIGQIAVNVHDLDKAVTFYRDVLGMPFLFHVPPNIAFFIAAISGLCDPARAGGFGYL